MVERKLTRQRAGWDLELQCGALTRWYEDGGYTVDLFDTADELIRAQAEGELLIEGL